MYELIKRNFLAALVANLLILAVLGLAMVVPGGRELSLGYGVAMLSVLGLGLLVSLLDQMFHLLPERDYHIMMAYTYITVCMAPLSALWRQCAGTCLLGAAVFILFRSSVVRASRMGPYFAAICIGVASLFFAPFLWYLPVFIFGLLRLRDFSVRDGVAFLAGLCTPLLYYWFFFWFTDTDPAPAYHHFIHCLSDVAPRFMPGSVSLLVVFLVLALVVFRALMRRMEEAGRSNISVRYYEFFAAFLLTGIMLGIAYSGWASAFIPLITIPVTYYVLVYFLSGHGKRYRVMKFVLAALLMVNYLDFFIKGL